MSESESARDIDGDPARSSGGGRPIVDGVLVTYNRPAELGPSIHAITMQDYGLRRLWVVDNGDRPEQTGELLSVLTSPVDVRHHPTWDNLGPAGGLARGLEHVFAEEVVADWVALFDDDDPPTSERIVTELVAFGEALLAAGEPVGGVGLRGGRMDWMRGRPVLPPSIAEPTQVDYLHGGYVPLYRTAAVMDSPKFNPALFWGFDDLAFGLGVRSRGYRLFVHGALWSEVKATYVQAQPRSRPHLLVEGAAGRRYYALRNLVWILRQYGHPVVAFRIGVVRGMLKPLLNLLIRPRTAWAHLPLRVRGFLDGQRGKLGRTVPLG